MRIDLEAAGDLGYRNPMALHLATLVELWRSPEFAAGLVDEVVEGLGATDARVLWELGYRRECRPGVLASVIGIGAPSISKSTARLLGRGLIAAAPDPTDARATVLRLTGEGEAVTRRLYQVGDSFIDRLTADWTDEDRRIATSLLARLARRAQDFSGVGDN
ncbi:MarR family winged helix-turn-helix transcriptional regulator [Lysinimonas soli]|uniref:MarR family winged helix-turn-helix transcriptional regulator n=1 Tax=Lysinimonas soli TaxID=1074233 RepID=A0ABW0NQ11_9MICO